MSAKEQVLEAIRNLPDDASIDQIADRVHFIAAVQRGLNDLERGAVVSHEDVKKLLLSGGW